MIEALLRACADWLQRGRRIRLFLVRRRDRQLGSIPSELLRAFPVNYSGAFPRRRWYPDGRFAFGRLAPWHPGAGWVSGFGYRSVCGTKFVLCSLLSSASLSPVKLPPAASSEIFLKYRSCPPGSVQSSMHAGVAPTFLKL